MYPSVENLYFYAQEERAGGLLRTSEYIRAVYGLEESWNALCAALTEEQRRMLDAFLTQRGEVSRLEDEASFTAGLSIGLELGRV